MLPFVDDFTSLPLPHVFCSRSRSSGLPALFGLGHADSGRSNAKVKDAAVQEAQQIRKLAEEGARSGAYLYPFRGIYYLATHKDLYKPLFAKLTPTLGLGAVVTTLMFLFTYLPQVAVLVFTSGPLAALTTILLVLSESSTLTMVLSRALLIEDSLVDTFDGTLIAQGQSTLVQKQRQVKSGAASDAVARLGKLVSKPFAKFTPQAIVRYLMYLPLNLIPVVGTVAFVILQGRKNGPSAHSRYFQLKGMTQTQKEEHVEERKGAYTSFGIAATLLEMIPIAGIFFAFSNTCGAALWASDMENKKTSVAPQLREETKKAA
nr:outer spore wall protein rrt8 [Quercus suber]